MATYPEKPTDFEALAAPFSPAIQELSWQLRGLIFQVESEAQELVSGGLKVANALYRESTQGKVFCGIQPSEAYCKLFVHNITEAADLGLEIEGSGKFVRHVKVRSGKFTEESFRNLLERARKQTTRRA